MAKHIRLVGIVALGGVVVIAALVVILNQPGTVIVTPVVQATATPAATAQTTSANSMTLRDFMLRLADDDPYYGPEDAPVIMVEFSDYLCPWCGTFYFNTLPQLLAAYPTQLRYIHRDYPVLGLNDPDAPERAALAAGCALDQGFFWQMHSALFEPYKDMDMSQHMQGGPPDPAEREALSRPYTADALRATAETIGLDMVAYDACVAEQAPAAEIVHDLQDGMQLEISSVPTYIINGVLVQGAQSLEVFSQVIDEALADSTAG